MKKSRVVLLGLYLASALALPGLSMRKPGPSPGGRYDIRRRHADRSNVYITYKSIGPRIAGLSAGSLHPVVSSAAKPPRTFDPDLPGMPRGATVYITGETVLSTGEKSTLYPRVPVECPRRRSEQPSRLERTFHRVARSVVVNEGESGAYTATGMWSNGSTPAIARRGAGIPICVDRRGRRTDRDGGVGRPAGDGEGERTRTDRRQESDDRGRAPP